jgi:hypothetical protein
MLPRLIQRVEAKFPALGPPVTNELWDSALPDLCDDFAEQASRLISTLQMSMPRRLLEESTQELVASRDPAIVICEFRLRPKSSYYARMGRAVPSPENPTGPHATGVALSVVLCRGYVSRTGTRAACISVEFDVWGSFERACFANLLRDHGYSIERLLGKRNLNFTTACPFENIEKTEYEDINKKLHLYYENEDPESNFTITRELRHQEVEGEVAKSFLPIAALYDMALGYCLPQEERARAFDYLALL